jgi:3-oxoacyl-[acyl-carrier protein] reductase
LEGRAFARDAYDLASQRIYLQQKHPTIMTPASDSRALPKVLSLEGRRALVAGAASGIGRAAAVSLAELGADLVLADRAPLDEVCAEVEATGRTALALHGDLTDERFLQRIIASGPYFSFAHVAGVFRGPKGASPEEEFDFVMRVNVRAPLILGNALIEQMNGGYIVLVGSTAGRSGAGRFGTPIEYATYAASKGGVHTLVRVLARRAAEKNVMVNGVAPGLVQTPLLDSVRPNAAATESVKPGTRAADPKELGWPIALLCSPMASFISGAIVDVNGGSFIG